MNIRMLLLAALLGGVARPGQAQVPLLTGAVDIELTSGVLRGDVCLEDLPMTGDSAWFLLNHGLNPKRVRDGEGATLRHTTRRDLHGVAVAYGAGGMTEPRVLCVEYVGAFPVYDVAAGDYRASDGSSVVAFNGRTMRARGETRWYPTPYDPAADRTFDELRYRLSVRCTECERIYVNGSPPAAGPIAETASNEPRELLLFVGDYPHQVVDGVHFLGENVPADTARRFIRLMEEVQRFYADYLGVEYGESLDVLRIVPVRFDRVGQFWGFFADPALGLVGLTIAQFVEILGDPAHPARPLVLGALAHELAHRYFAGSLAAEGEYFQLFSEPFATFLDLKATRHFEGEEAYVGRVRSLAREVLDGPALPRLARAGPDDLAQDVYRYGYAPLLLLALERTVGEEAMREMLRQLLIAADDERGVADYAFLRTVASRAGIAHSAWRRWEEDCVVPPIAENHCLRAFADAAGAD